MYKELKIKINYNPKSNLYILKVAKSKTNNYLEKNNLLQP